MGAADQYRAHDGVFGEVWDISIRDCSFGPNKIRRVGLFCCRLALSDEMNNQTCPCPERDQAAVLRLVSTEGTTAQLVDTMLVMS